MEYIYAQYSGLFTFARFKVRFNNQYMRCGGTMADREVDVCVKGGYMRVGSVGKVRE